MATVIMHWCDRCGEQIHVDRSEFKARCGPLRDRRSSVDLCSTCAAGFDEWLGPVPGRKSAPTPLSPEPAAPAD